MPRNKNNFKWNSKPPPSTSDAVAVALAHDIKTDRAPKVVAGGRGKVAEQILQIAFQNGVKVREDADLAQFLSAIDIDTEIPLEAFAAVAEILIYVYQANNGQPDDNADNAPTISIQKMADKWKNPINSN